MSKEKRLGRGLEALLGKVAMETLTDTPHQETSHSYEKTSFPGTATLDYGESDESKDPFFHVNEEGHSIFAHPALSQPHNENHTAAVNAPELGIDTPLPQSAIDILLIDKNPYQPRLDFDPKEIQSLADSIQTHGLLQPLVVRKVNDRYQLIAGERRLRAALLAGWQEVSVHVLAVDDRQLAELALTENLQRRDLNAIEKALAFQRYLDTYGGKHEELAKRLELERSTVTNFLRLLDLPEEVREMVLNDEITQGHAKAILPLKEVWERIDVAIQVRDEGWSVRQTEQYVRDILDGVVHEKSWGKETKEKALRKSAEQDDQTASLEQDFRNMLGSKVQLTHNNKGRGKIVISFTSHDEFDRIYQLICQLKKAKK
ncbi:MAG: ParB/RepB/Spo0J family partition protein [Planctomycetaceae bacterium]|nr:ParB/RepB/Spo0J family partition protein [Planctomycetaceae bacterium]